MEVFKIVVTIQSLICYGALQNLTTSNLPESEKHGKESKLYITQSSRLCSWKVISPGENQSLPAFKQPLHPLATEVCQNLGCGEVYELIERTADPNSSCLTGCIYHNNTLNNCSRASAGDCRVISEIICAQLYITQSSRFCSWRVTSPGKKLSSPAFKQQLHPLATEVCQSLGCGEVYELIERTADPNSSCLTGCIYHNSTLINCSHASAGDCRVISEIICGKSQVKLTGGSYHCAGRVELWRAGQWGTVCDDEWDERDADVVCAQLGCGYAVSVTGQGKPYGQGSGPIYRDELNCTGKERSLWECPAVMDDHDCGHKEDAGVMCSEYRLRLTGGRDNCSGRVEVHRRGSWGTVCDDFWDKEAASLACTMLDCGEANKYTGFEKPFTHDNGTRWIYGCKKSNKILWNCTETAITAHNRHVCLDEKAAGVICSNSIELLLVPSTPNATTPVLTTTTMQMTTAKPKGSWSLELLGCIGLSLALLIALILNIILCFCTKKRKALIVQKQYPNLQTTAVSEENNYRDSVHLVKVTSNDHTPNAQIMTPQMWTQSSVESASYDTDYEPSDSGPDTFPLSTFRNSMRYSAEGRIPGLQGTNLQSVTEEDPGGPDGTTMRGYQHQYRPTGAFQGVTAASSEDSFESSSTSSGECYENTDLCNVENYENNGDLRSDLLTETLPHSVVTNHNTESQTEDFLQDQRNVFMFNHDQGLVRKSSSGEDSPIYSPVSADTDLFSPVSAKTDPYSSDSDYDDVAYLQRPHQLP